MTSGALNPERALRERLSAVVQKESANPRSGEISLAFENPKLGIALDLSHQLDRKFFAASVTKMFSAACLLKLQNSKIHSLDEPISNYLTAEELQGLVVTKGEDFSDQLSIRKLALNQSGIADYYQAKKLDPKSDIASVTSADPGWTFHDAVALAKEQPSAANKVKSRAHYSFTNFQILSEVIERATAKPLAQVFDEQLIEPFGLSNTFLFTKADQGKTDSIAPLRFGSQSYLGFMRMASLRGEGAIVSTASDLIAFLKRLSNADSGKPVIETMSQDSRPLFPFIRYGLGIMSVRVPGVLMGSPRTPKLLGHFGATGSFAFYEQTTGSYFAGTVNQLGDPRIGSSFMFRAVAEAMKVLPKA